MYNAAFGILFHYISEPLTWTQVLFDVPICPWYDWIKSSTFYYESWIVVSTVCILFKGAHPRCLGWPPWLLISVRISMSFAAGPVNIHTVLCELCLLSSPFLKLVLAWAYCIAFSISWKCSLIGRLTLPEPCGCSNSTWTSAWYGDVMCVSVSEENWGAWKYIGESNYLPHIRCTFAFRYLSPRNIPSIT